MSRNLASTVASFPVVRRQDLRYPQSISARLDPILVGACRDSRTTFFLPGIATGASDILAEVGVRSPPGLRQPVAHLSSFLQEQPVVVVAPPPSWQVV